jgi:hypothetical protein
MARGQDTGSHPNRAVHKDRFFGAEDVASFNATVAADPPKNEAEMSDDEWLRHMMGKYGPGVTT